MTTQEALLQAAREGDLAAATRSLADGAAPDSRGENGETPLMLAAVGGHAFILRLLLTSGAAPNLTSEKLKTALMFAAENGRERAAAILLEAGADPNAQGRHAPSALHLAVKSDHAGLVKLLLGHGADPGQRGDSSLTPLESAAALGSVEAVNCLITHGGSASCLAAALRLAAVAGKTAAVGALLVAAAPLEGRDDDGFTPLMLAALNGRLDTLRLLLDAGADIRAVSGNGMSALDCARVQDHEPMAALLRERGVARGARSDPEARPARKRLLVVDDDREVVTLLQALFEKNGLEVIPAYDGQEALEKARNSPPDLVITDGMMPRMHGITLCEELRKLSAMSRIPIIFSPSGRLENPDYYCSKGVDALISKPWHSKELLDLVKSLLALGRSAAPPAA
jgi:ankyrin repeat protein/CheY-like chemotaxis protein